MFVNQPGIAWIAPKRGVSTVNVPYNETAGSVDWQTVPLAAATYNNDGTTYADVTLSLTAGNLTGSGLTIGSTTFDNAVGTAERNIEGEPASLGEDTNFNITVRAVETGATSYNNERTLTITILQDPVYVSPS
jgi:hypothetical protein